MREEILNALKNPELMIFEIKNRLKGTSYIPLDKAIIETFDSPTYYDRTFVEEFLFDLEDMD